jgi:hypothetical protein
MPPIPVLRACLTTAVVMEAAGRLVVTGPPWILDGRLGQNHGWPPWAIVPPGPLADDAGLEGLGLKGAAVEGEPGLRRARWLVTRPLGKAHDFRRQPRGPAGFALLGADHVHLAPNRHALTRSGLGLGVDRPGPLRWGLPHPNEALLDEPPPSAPLPKAASQDDLGPAGARARRVRFDKTARSRTFRVTR